MSNDFITMGERIEDLMKEKGVTQKQVAEAIKMTPGNFSKLINGENTNPKINAIIELAKYFEVSADYLLCLSNYRTPQSADIGAITGLSDETINALNYDVRYFETSYKVLEEIDTQDDISIDFLQKEYFNILNYFITELVKSGIVHNLQACKSNFSAVYNVENAAPISFSIQKDKALLNLIQGDNTRKEIRYKLLHLVDKCINYQSQKLKVITQKFLNKLNYNFIDEEYEDLFDQIDAAIYAKMHIEEGET